MLGLEGVSEHEAYRYGDHASEATLSLNTLLHCSQQPVCLWRACVLLLL